MLNCECMHAREVGEWSGICCKCMYSVRMYSVVPSSAEAFGIIPELLILLLPELVWSSQKLIC